MRHATYIRLADRKTPPVNRSLTIAAIITLVLVGYFGIRSLMRGSLGAEKEAVPAPAVADVTDAIVIETANQAHMMRLTVRGRTAPDKSVVVKAGTTGNVVSTPVREGTFVRQGTLLCGLDIEARNARLREAEALRDAARVDYEAAASLAAKGLAPANRETAAKASLDAAEAAVNAARVEISRTQIRAPFDGVFDQRLAEAGDFLAPGSPCGVLVDLNPVIAAGEATEAEAGLLRPGMPVTATLADGRTFPGKLRFVARTASQQTRTFPIEAELDTGGAVVPAGVTASITIPAGEVPAALIARSLLTLDDAGRLGVRHVTADNVVAFAPIRVINETPEGAWVTGLPATARLIAVGQDYLNEGVRVRPVPAGGAQP